MSVTSEPISTDLLLFSLQLSAAPLAFTEELYGALKNGQLVSGLMALANEGAPSSLSAGLQDWCRNRAQQNRAKRTLAHCEELGVALLVWDDPRYPALLRQIYRPPLVLFVRSQKAAPLSWDWPRVAVVGSRKADQSGIDIAWALSENAARRGVLVVSGLAAGIDAAAHRGALASQRPASTLAVLGHGHEHLYPRMHTSLAQEILEAGGSLVSQFEPEVPPLPQNFIARNRIIAGLSRAVVVVQASARSGSLATARFALEEGRDVLVAPGSIDDPRYEGSNRLLKQGAHVVTGAADVLEFFPEASANSEFSAPEAPGLVDGVQTEILNLLSSKRAVEFDALLELPFSLTELQAALFELELSGLIERVPGNLLVARRAQNA